MKNLKLHEIMMIFKICKECSEKIKLWTDGEIIYVKGVYTVVVFKDVDRDEAIRNFYLSKAQKMYQIEH